MENIEQILQKLVAVNLPPLESDKVQHLIKHAFEAGKAEKTDPLEGFSNLTDAIKAGEPIDWERLDGLKTQCVNHDVGTNRGELGRNETYTSERSAGWFYKSMDKTYVRSLIDAWRGDDGWTLWVEGEVPLRRKTADQLEVGHFFTGVLSDTIRESLMCVAGELGNGKRVRYAYDFMPSHHPAEKWEVIEEHGTFQKPEGK